MMRKNSRRHLLRGIAGLLGSTSLAGKAASVGTLTPSAAEGPFYPKPSMRMPDDDNDLVKIAGLVEAAGGEVLLCAAPLQIKTVSPLPNIG